MPNKGGNKGRQDAKRTEGGAQEFEKDKAVARDPDIRGVNRKESRG